MCQTNKLNIYRAGIDLSSTIIKTVVFNHSGDIVYKNYKRHNAKVPETLCEIFEEIRRTIGDDAMISTGVTGSVGMGVAEKCGLPFVQKVVAATKAIRHQGFKVSSMIDIGGEDIDNLQ